ncbi:MAG TPA: protein kinase [Burkholderiaceae bacterium]|nr:protein kinase [Burkholderiaceae bacterium]
MARIDGARWAILSPLLDELLDADDEHRRERLAGIRRDNAALADELEALLAREAAADRDPFLDDAPFAQLNEPGDLVGSYTLEREIGQGGMAFVWLARRSDGRFEGKAAIKFLDSARFTRGGAERFQREGSLLARLAHPNIARLIDAGVTERGQPYLVLEYVEGDPIDRWCDRHGLDSTARVRLFLDVLAAVAHAHGKLILHRDLKPSNILVTADGGVKLLDFGIAKLLDDQQQPVAATELTQLAGRVFTPDFAAPEQVQAGEVTMATDVYALGVLLYLLLSGAHPTTVATQTPVERLRAIVETEPARLSDVILRTTRAAAAQQAGKPERRARVLRGDLDNIVAKALKKAPAERYRTVDAFADDLRRYLNHEPVSARGDSLAYRLARFTRRHRLAVGAAAAVVLTLVAGVAATTWQAIEARRQRAEAIAQRDRAQVLLSRNEAIFDFFDLMLTEGVTSEQAEAIQKMLERGTGLIDIASAGQPERQAEILRVLATYYIDLDNAQKAAALLDRARRLVPEDGDRSLSAQLACAHASAMALLGQRQQAIDLLDKWGSDTSIDPNVGAYCLQTRAIVAQNDVDAKQVMHFVELALQRVRQAPVPSPRLEASLLGDMGFALHLAGDNGAADQHYQEALDRLTRLGQRESKEARRLMADWGVVSFGSGDFKRGVALLEELLRTIERLNGAAPIPAGLIGNYAFGLEVLARNQEALQAYDQTYASAEATGFLAAQAYALIGKASVYTRLEDYAQAERDLRRAAALMGSQVPEAHASQIRLRMTQARIDHAQGRDDAASRTFTRVIELLEARGAATPAVASAYRLRAEIEAKQGRQDAALADARKALQVAEGMQGGKPYSDDTGLAYLSLGRVLQAAGDRDGARKALQSAADHLANSVGDRHPDTRTAQQLLAQLGA